MDWIREHLLERLRVRSTAVTEFRIFDRYELEDRVLAEARKRIEKLTDELDRNESRTQT